MKGRYLIAFAALCLLLLSSIPRPEYPRPQLRRQAWMSLNGWWDFAFDFSCSGEERGLPQGRGFDRRILVPFPPESKLSGIGFRDFMNCVWYRRSFRIPESWKGKRILLHFEAIDYRAKVWVNGRKVGSHEGGYTPFSFDITAYLKEGENLLVVKAEDDPRSGLQPRGKQSPRYASYGCIYSRTTGIWQSVWLEPVPQVYITSYRVFPEIESSTAGVEVFLNTYPKGLRLRLTAYLKGRRVGRAEKFASRTNVFQLKLKKLSLWEPSSPTLYDLKIELLRGSRVVDRVEGYFGMRQIRAEGNKILLNGKPVFLRMVLDQGYYPDGIYTAPSDEALRRDIEIAKAAGFNGARLHQKVFERRFLYWADRLGYLVWGEFADWGLQLNRPAAARIMASQWLEVLQRDFNHPSIIGWCPFNERWSASDAPVVRHIFRLTKAFDPTRLVIDSSGGFHVVDPDVYDAHNYEQNVRKFAEAFAGLLKKPPEVFVNGGPARNVPYKGQPYFVSEYGGTWWNPGQKDRKAWGYGRRPKSSKEFLDRYRKLTEALLFNPAVAGFCYTQLYDIEQEVNGLYTYQRKPKFDPAIFYRINTQRAAIEK